ncbi:chromate efflux transporter [Arenimonas daejeonensis]|uniref:chromate efflux transporter n=1 Tax=Arenimonas daejeonensis TaxID=370777 RepID=UPI0011BF1B9F|nr:chromate efflux transporter [Arenimonas daejeonensis]
MKPTFAQALKFWWTLGWISFGGPAGQIAVMHAELVERRRWVDEAGFLHALNYCMLLPGPEAMQLATYLGWRLHGLRGGLAAGVLFVLPATLLLALLSWAYLRFGALPVVGGISLGLSAAVLALLLQAVIRLGRRVLKRGFARMLAMLALIGLGAGLAFPWIVLGAALLGLCAGRFRPGWLTVELHQDASPSLPGTGRADPGKRRALMLAVALLAAWWLPLLAVRAALGADSTAWAQAVFFSQAAMVTFGGAYAVLPYVAQLAVEQHQWLTTGQMMVGLGLAETTPGPLIIVLEFVGFVGGWQHPDLASPLASALLGAVVTVWATFLPSFLFVLPVAPWIESLRDRPLLAAAIGGISAAVVGVIVNLALWFGLHLYAGRRPAEIVLITAVALLAWFALARGRHVLAVVVVAALAGGLWQVSGA